MVGIIGNNIIYDLNNLPGQQGCSLLVTITGHVTSQFQFPSIHSSLSLALSLPIFDYHFLPFFHTAPHPWFTHHHQQHSRLWNQYQTWLSSLSLSLFHPPSVFFTKKHFPLRVLHYHILDSVVTVTAAKTHITTTVVTRTMEETRLSFSLSLLHFYSLVLSKRPVTNEKETWIKNEEQSR